MNAIQYGFDCIGYFGPQILFLVTIFFIRAKPTFLFWYIIGYLLNIGINIVLKLWIQEPRPSEDRALFHISLTHGKRIGFDQYGMPSGHAQQVFYSTLFVTLLLKNYWITIVYSLISVCTAIQRVQYKNHTISQVIWGSIVGAIVGTVFYYVAAKKLIGIITNKQDDNAPI